jgi:hypothetical protein
VLEQFIGPGVGAGRDAGVAVSAKCATSGRSEVMHKAVLLALCNFELADFNALRPVGVTAVVVVAVTAVVVVAVVVDHSGAV